MRWVEPPGGRRVGNAGSTRVMRYRSRCSRDSRDDRSVRAPRLPHAAPQGARDSRSARRPFLSAQARGGAGGSCTAPSPAPRGRSRTWQGEGSTPESGSDRASRVCSSVGSISSPGSRERVAALSLSLEVFTLTPQVNARTGSPRGARLQQELPRKTGRATQGFSRVRRETPSGRTGRIALSSDHPYRIVVCMSRLTASRSSLSGRGARCARRRRVSTRSSDGRRSEKDATAHPPIPSFNPRNRVGRHGLSSRSLGR